MYHTIDDLNKMSRNDLITIVLLLKEKLKKRDNTIKKMSYIIEEQVKHGN